MTKFKKFLVSLLSCCMALVLVFAAGCTEPDDSSASSGSSATSSSESQTSSTESSSSSTDTASSSESESTEATTSNSDSESSDSTESSSETESSDSTGSETGGDQEGDDYTLTSTTVYFVGDSTVCEFSDSYYLPRYGYGTQFYNYINTSYVSVVNLALSGRSSKSFITEDNYDYLVNGSTEKGIEAIGEGDYLIIGFGHNDEKDTDSDRYTNPNLNALSDTTSFQYYLYNYYIKVAEDVGATPILCTPIVRYNSSNDYSGSSGHVTSKGDYAACIRDLAEQCNITCVDLTSITTDLYENLKTEAQWFHAFTKAKLADDGDTTARAVALKGSETSEKVNVIPDGMDSTHINKYGAKMISYQIATALQSARKTCNLGYYVLSNISEPTKANDLEDAYNASYEYKPYSAPTLASLTPISTVTDSVDNTTTYNLYSSVFGDIGKAANISAYSISYSNDAYSISNTGTVAGKIASSADGLGTVFTQIDVTKSFSASVNVKVTGFASSNSTTSQTAFGLMLRDDMYVNTYDNGISSNYVAAGLIDQSNGNVIFSRENGSLTKGKTKLGAMAVDDTYNISISGGGQVFTVTVKKIDTTTNTVSGTYTETYTDFSFTATDENYIYLCMFAARGIAVEFSDFTFAITGDAQSA